VEPAVESFNAAGKGRAVVSIAEWLNSELFGWHESFLVTALTRLSGPREELLVTSCGCAEARARLGRVQQGFDETLSIRKGEGPGFMFLDDTDRGFVGGLNDEIRTREPLDRGGSIDTPLLLGKKSGFGPFGA
jgi:hypothetical protein